MYGIYCDSCMIIRSQAFHWAHKHQMVKQVYNSWEINIYVYVVLVDAWWHWQSPLTFFLGHNIHRQFSQNRLLHCPESPPLYQSQDIMRILHLWDRQFKPDNHQNRCKNHSTKIKALENFQFYGFIGSLTWWTISILQGSRDQVLPWAVYSLRYLLGEKIIYDPYIFCFQWGKWLSRPSGNWSYRSL